MSNKTRNDRFNVDYKHLRKVLTDAGIWTPFPKVVLSKEVVDMWRTNMKGGDIELFEGELG